MISLEKIKEDLGVALKQSDLIGQSVLRLLMSEIQNKEKEKRYTLSKEGLEESELDNKSKLNEEEIQKVLLQEAKKRRDSIKEFEKGGRSDLVNKELSELSFLEKYLPEQLSKEEIEQQVKDYISETGETDFGKIMSVLVAKNKGKADGSIISQAVRSALEQK